MPYIKKKGVTYGGIPNGAAGSKDPTSVVPTTVKQLTRVGGTQDFAPVTIPSAVKFSNGDTLETMIGSVATIETSPAVVTHAIGDFIFYNGQIYEVIAAIAVGETLTVGTNIQATSVGEELSELKSGLIHYKDIDATTNQNGNLPTSTVGLSSADVAIMSVITRVAPSRALVFNPYTATTQAYGIHVSDDGLSPVNNTAVKLRVYYINR